MSAAINTVNFDLTTLNLYDSVSGQFKPTTLQGHMYTVEGVKNSDGSLRKLSLAELVMVICLARAQEKENAVIALMQTMSENTATLEKLTSIENDLVNNGTTSTENRNYLNSLGINGWAGKDDLITAIESKMDSLNSFSQQKMIELQSETSKRDQSYDMITNILKSLNTVQVGNANNI